MTVLAGFLALLCIPDSPLLCGRWLAPAEIRYLDLRQRADTSRQAAARDATQAKKQDLKVLVSALSDWQIHLQVLQHFRRQQWHEVDDATDREEYGFHCDQRPAADVAGAISSWVSALLADRSCWRFPIVGGPLKVVVAAMAVPFAKAGDAENSTGVMYFAMVLVCIDLYPLHRATSTWSLNDLAGPSKHAMGVAQMSGKLYLRKSCPLIPFEQLSSSCQKAASKA